MKTLIKNTFYSSLFILFWGSLFGFIYNIFIYNPVDNLQFEKPLYNKIIVYENIHKDCYIAKNPGHKHIFKCFDFRIKRSKYENK